MEHANHHNHDMMMMTTTSEPIMNHHEHHQHHSEDMSSMGDMNHDKGHHMMGHMGGMMMMYFHFGYNEVILFDFWRINSVGGLILSMFICFLMGLFYEGLKFFREVVVRSYNTRSSTNSYDDPEQKDVVVNGSGNGDNPALVSKNNGDASSSSESNLVKIVKTSMWSKVHLLQTILHFLQIILSYFLMLIFMTYNVWLCLAVALGDTVGFFIFGWRRSVVMDVSDHCH